MHVPSLPELAQQGLAHPVEWNKKREATHYTATSEGQRVIYSCMKHNAELLRSDEGLRREAETAAIRRAKYGEGTN